MKDYSQYSDEEMMKEIRAGNMLAFDALYRKYSRRLYKFSYSILKSTQEAENNIQDVFLNLWLNRTKIEKSSSVKYYVFTIAYNSAISIIRKKAKETQFIEYVKTLQDFTQEPVDLQIEYHELDEKLDEIINALPGRQKEVYLLHRVEGLKYAEIAERMNISINTIENHMSRALKTIRKKLANYSLPVILFCFLYI
jgi:RNA polymerase sigma-70 factor (ECF subfamily)